MGRGLLRARAIVWMLPALSALACQANSVTDDFDGITTVILVRHAEKELSGDDPGLTAAGAARAAALAHAVGEANVAAVYATEFARTRNTALPLAELAGLDVTVVPSGDSYAADMAGIVHARHAGQVVVIVSHSNTVPAIIGALGASPMPTIDEDEYDDLFVVTITRGGAAAMLPLRYGAETP